MKSAILIILLFVNGFLVPAQTAPGSLRLCVRTAETNESFEDTITVSMEGITRRTLRAKPDSNGCVLLQKLEPGNYTIKVNATDCVEEKIKGVIVKDAGPVLLDLRLKSSIIQLSMELTACATPLIPITAQTRRPTAEELNARELAEAKYKAYAIKQKQEHEHLKNGSWQIADSLRNDSIADLKTWHERMRKNLRYPQYARDMGIDGKIYFGFETDEKGHIQNIELLRGHDAELTVELAHTLNKAPGIFPPKNELGKAVRQKYILSVRYTLKD